MTADRISVMDESAARRAIARMARELVERNAGAEGLVLLGIHRRGTQITELLRAEIEEAEGIRVPSGSIDITLYRDDLLAIGPRPVVGATELPADGIDNTSVVLIDDVLFTGRTTLAAMNELMAWGRPSQIHLCVLVDRGGRELPVHADVVGRLVETLEENQTVEVLVPELDGRLGVDLVHTHPESK